MIRTQNIRSLTDFRQHAADHLEQLAKSGDIEVLTVNGEAKAVIMSPKTFDDLAERAHQAEISLKIKRGMAEIEAGKGVDSRKAMGKIADKHGLAMKP